MGIQKEKNTTKTNQWLLLHSSGGGSKMRRGINFPDSRKTALVLAVSHDICSSPLSKKAIVESTRRAGLRVGSWQTCRRFNLKELNRFSSTPSCIDKKSLFDYTGEKESHPCPPTLRIHVILFTVCRGVAGIQSLLYTSGTCNNETRVTLCSATEHWKSILADDWI